MNDAKNELKRAAPEAGIGSYFKAKSFLNFIFSILKSAFQFSAVEYWKNFHLCSMSYLKGCASYVIFCNSKISTKADTVLKLH